MKKIWSYQLQNKQHYIDSFKKILPQNRRVRSVERTWYKSRYHWRLAFNFKNDHRVSWASREWREMLEIFDHYNWQFRHRAEVNGAIFTNESALLDAVLAESKWADALVEVEYTDENYLSEFKHHADIDAVTDIKFTKRPTEFIYKVTLGNFAWRTDQELRERLGEYLAANEKEYLFRGFEKDTIDNIKNKKKYNHYGNKPAVFDGFTFYARNADDILMIHIMAANKVTKIIKYVEKTN